MFKFGGNACFALPVRATLVTLTSFQDHSGFEQLQVKLAFGVFSDVV